MRAGNQSKRAKRRKQPRQDRIGGEKEQKVSQRWFKCLRLPEFVAWQPQIAQPLSGLTERGGNRGEMLCGVAAHTSEHSPRLAAAQEKCQDRPNCW